MRASIRSTRSCTGRPGDERRKGGVLDVDQARSGIRKCGLGGLPRLPMRALGEVPSNDTIVPEAAPIPGRCWAAVRTSRRTVLRRFGPVDSHRREISAPRARPHARPRPLGAAGVRLGVRGIGEGAGSIASESRRRGGAGGLGGIAVEAHGLQDRFRSLPRAERPPTKAADSFAVISSAPATPTRDGRIDWRSRPRADKTAAVRRSRFRRGSPTRVVNRRASFLPERRSPRR